MEINEKRYDEEKLILTAMIVDKNVLGRISTKWKPNSFRSSWANIVAEWAVQYYINYQKSPGPNIEGIFETWASEKRHRNLVEPMEAFLAGLSKRYTKLRSQNNSEFVIDTAGKFFNKVQLERLAESIQADIDIGKDQKALTRVQDYKHIDLGIGSSISVFEDTDAIRRAFEEDREPLIKYSGGLERFFGDRLERDAFIAFMGPEKRGKTFWLLDMAFRGVSQNRRVAFFEVGDMSQKQIYRRFMVRVSKHPMRAKTIQYPISISKPSMDRKRKDPKIQYEDKVFSKPLSWRKAHLACRHFLRRHKEKDLLRLSTHPNDTVSVDDLRTILDTWKQEYNWIPDVVIVDYADILNMDAYGVEGRDRIDRTWKRLRRMSQELHCLVVTATQSDASSYQAYTLGQQHFSDDKRKHSHVTGIVGLNQTQSEKEQGIMRLNWIDLRESEYNVRRCCYVACCFDLANMAVRSDF